MILKLSAFTGVALSSYPRVLIDIFVDGHRAYTAENWDSPQTVTLTAGTDDDALNFWQEILHTADVEGFVVGRHNEALADCTTAIELDPDDAGRWRRRTGNRRWPA